MSRPKRQKIDRDTTAAYAASQPLFGALRDANLRIDAQRDHLAVASKVVQSLHVKIANDDSHNDISRHKAYMDAAVKAWMSSTDAFCAIFEQLVNVTAAEPAQGREAGTRYEEFVNMLDTARKAKESAEKFLGDEEEEGGQSSAEEGAEEVEDEESESASAPASKPTPSTNGSESNPTLVPPQSAQKQSILSGGVRYNKSGDKLLWQDNELKVPYETLELDEQKAWTVIKKRNKRLQHRRKHQAQKSSMSGSKPNSAEQTTKAEPEEDQQVPQPEVEYEDISGEVEARLKAKAERKAAEKAKKAEKKRKRESRDSLAVTEGEDATVEPSGDREDSAVAPSQKPAKKKAKTAPESVTVPAANGNQERKTKKRKEALDETDVQEEAAAEQKPAKKKAKTAPESATVPIVNGVQSKQTKKRKEALNDTEILEDDVLEEKPASKKRKKAKA